MVHTSMVVTGRQSNWTVGSTGESSPPAPLSPGDPPSVRRDLTLLLRRSPDELMLFTSDVPLVLHHKRKEKNEKRRERRSAEREFQLKIVLLEDKPWQ